MWIHQTIKRIAHLLHKVLCKNFLLKLTCLGLIIIIVHLYKLIKEILLTEDFQNFDYPMSGDIYQKIELHGTGIIPMLNPSEFRVKFSEVQGREGLLFLYLIKSRYESVEMRNFIRSSWANQKCAGKSNATWAHVFLFGELERKNVELQRSLRKESQIHKDIVILDYIDNYYNNTYKVFGGLDYGIKEFPDAKYLVVIDDDYFVHPLNHAEYIKGIHSSRYEIFVGGSIWYKSMPKRVLSKWSISYEMYPFSFFPDYPAGGHVIFSMPMAKKVSIAFRYTMYMAFDDVLIGIILFKLGIAPKQVPGMCKVNREYTTLKYDKLISIHGDKDLKYIKAQWQKYRLSEFCGLDENS